MFLKLLIYLEEEDTCIPWRYSFSLYILFILQNDSVEHAVSQFHKACYKCYQNFVSEIVVINMMAKRLEVFLLMK